MIKDYIDLTDIAINTIDFLNLRKSITKDYRSTYRKELEEWYDSLPCWKETEDINNVSSIIDWYEYYLANYY